MRNRTTDELYRATEARVPDYRDHHKFPGARVIFPCPPVVNAELNRLAHGRDERFCTFRDVALQKVGLPSRGFFRASWREDRETKEDEEADLLGFSD